MAAAIAIGTILHDLQPSTESASTTLVVSLDTPSNHFRNRLLHDFAERLQTVSGGELTLEIYESGQLMSDRDVAKALALGLIDFAIPADSKIARFEPNAALLSLPVFYGQPSNIVYSLVDGPVGDRIRASIESQLDVVVLDPVLDLGFTATYSTEKPLRSLRDYSGLKVRFPGGVGPAELFKQLGAVPVAVPFPDVPLALSQGNLDAIQSTHETVRSAKLWDAGLNYCLEDNAYLIQYIPMVSQQALQKLSPAQEKILFDSWREVASGTRTKSIQHQRDAREVLTENGITCETLEPENNADLNDSLVRASRDVATRIGIDPIIVDDALTHLGHTSK